MKKIIFGITGLTLGGAERTLVDIANRLCYRYEVTIFCLYSGGELEKELSNKIKLIHLCKKSYNELTKIEKVYMSLKILFNRKYLYKTYIWGKYDKEIAFLEGPITRIFACSKDKNKKNAWIHNDIGKVFGNNLKSKLKSILDKKAYKKYGKLIFVSKDNLEKFNKKYKIKNEKQVIYNYIEKDEVLKKANKKIDFEFPKDRINFVTVARLVHQKAIDRLIKVHSKLIKEGYKHNFYIIGDGPEKQELEELIQTEKVAETFKLLGKKENPYPYMKGADYFCLLTYFEGYPMVLEEAKILNKYILITDTAARETVQNYNKSEIFENTEEEIYKGLKNIISNNVGVDAHGDQNKPESTNNNISNYDNRTIIEQICKIIEE